MSLTSLSRSSAPFLTESSVSAASYQSRSDHIPMCVLDLTTYLAQRVKHLVEVYQDLSLGDLCNVVHALARIVSDPSILIREASENGRDDLAEIAGDFLATSQHTCALYVFQKYLHTPPRAMAAAARPIKPPLRA